MKGLERTLSFISGAKTDKAPFHPIIMRFAAKYAKVNYRDFCLDYKSKCYAMAKCADDFDIDWVTVMSDPYAEAEAYGVKLNYPSDSLPEPVEYIIKDLADIDKLKVVKTSGNARMTNRVNEIKEYRKTYGDKYFVVGWAEGPLAEYADIRGFGEACFDLFDGPDQVKKALDVITETAIHFITEQVKAGADCIGIGDAACSQIGPDIYKDMCYEREKMLVTHIHSLGALAKLHICGNTSGILPDMINTGADIIDVDHLVGSMSPFLPLLGKKQVFSGNSDPVSVIQDGTPEKIRSSVISCYNDTKGRCIVSAGCEIPPGTTMENFKAYQKAVLDIKM